MARRRTGTISESLDTLEELQRHYQGEPQEIRLRALMLLKEEPMRTIEEVASLIGSSERSIRRWWSAYLQGGLPAILDQRAEPDGQGKQMKTRELELLARRIRRREFNSIEDVRSWLTEHHGIRYSRSEVQYILNVILNTDAPVLAGLFRCRPDPVADGTPANLAISSDIIRFLNALPLLDDTNAWSNSFRAALLTLFDDVDHIAVNINQTCELLHPEEYRPTVVFRQHVSAGDASSGSDVVVTADEELGRPCDRVLEQFRLQGRPLQEYHTPCSFDYYYSGYAYLATIFLFRERRKAPISERTVATFDALEPFLIYALANHVIWYQQTRPAEQIFYEGMRRLTKEAGLSTQEQRVAVYHILGYSYEEMADLLAISTKTVKKHINAIHHKTGTRRQRELFARYLSPRIGFPATEEK